MIVASFGTDLFQGFLQGLPPGTVYGLIALGFVLAYKTSGVFNLAFGAQAYISAALFFHAQREWGWEILPSFVLSVLVVAPLLGLLLERLIFRHLRPDQGLAKLVVAIGLSVALPNLFELIVGFEPVSGSRPTGVVPDGGVLYDPFGVYRFSRDELVAMGIALLATAGLALLFRYTAIGLQMRAVVESPRLTELAGVRAERVSAFSWMLSSFFAGLAGVLIAPTFSTLSAPDFFNLVVVAVAAAAFGKLVSLPRAMLGGLCLGVLIALINTFLPGWVDRFSWLDPIKTTFTPAVPFLVLLGLLTLWPSLRTAREHTDPMSGVDPPPTALAALSRSVGLTRVTRIFAVCFFSVVGWVILTEADAAWLFIVTQAVILATIFLSITVITGMAGQVSLCQGAFAAIGGFGVFQLVDRWEVPVLAGAVIGATIAAVVAGLVSLLVRRLGGVWVAIATLAFAAFFDAVMVRMPFVGGGGTSVLQGTRVPRPVIGPWDLADDRGFFVLSVIVFAVVGIVVIQIREGTAGSMLRSLRGSELASQSIGISPGRARIMAFAISGFIAGLGGALLSIHQENVNYETNFSPFAALFWLVLVVSLGCRTVEGAGYAGASYGLMDAVILKGAVVGWILRSEDRIPWFLPVSPKWRFILFGLATIQFAQHPEGLVESGKRKAHARIERRLAKRRGESDGADGAAQPSEARVGEVVS